MELQLSQTLTWEQLGSSEGYSSVQQDLIARKEMAGLEQRLCTYIGAAHCVSVDSATTAMLLALRAAGVEHGDGVLCTSFSYFATADIITLAGGKPVFVDINPNTFCIDPYCLEYVIGKCIRAKRPVPKALIAVDLFGLPCNYDALEEICGRHGIHLIEDMAQSFGATYKGRRAGSFGRMAVASFFPAKPLGEMGEGGAVFCSDLEDAKRLQSLRRKLGGNMGSHLDSVTASIVAEKLSNFDLELERRQEVAAHYRRRLEGAVRMQQVGEDYVSACTQFVVSLKNASIRTELVENLQQRHIPCTIFAPSPVNSRNPPDDWDKVALVNAQSVAQKILTIPIHPYLSNRVVEYICDCVLREIQHPEAAAPVPDSESAE